MFKLSTLLLVVGMAFLVSCEKKKPTIEAATVQNDLAVPKYEIRDPDPVLEDEPEEAEDVYGGEEGVLGAGMDADKLPEDRIDEPNEELGNGANDLE